MNIAMMQPSFMPWQGFFELIYKSDIFIFLDDFQFSVQSWHQRNRLFINRGQVDWYTIPIQKNTSFKAPLNQTIINESTPWRDKMWKRIQQNYSRAPYYSDFALFIEQWLTTKEESLATQNITLIKLICNLLNFHREFRFSSQLSSKQQRSHRVLELLRWCEARYYFCAQGSFEYMKDDGVLPVPDIEVVFQNFQPQAYPQVGSPNSFVPYLSIFDALFNIGVSATRELIVYGTPRWLTWPEMIAMHKKED